MSKLFKICLHTLVRFGPFLSTFCLYMSAFVHFHFRPFFSFHIHLYLFGLMFFIHVCLYLVHLVKGVSKFKVSDRFVENTKNTVFGAAAISDCEIVWIVCYNLKNARTEIRTSVTFCHHWTNIIDENFMLTFLLSSTTFLKKLKNSEPKCISNKLGIFQKCKKCKSRPILKVWTFKTKHSASFEII